MRWAQQGTSSYVCAANVHVVVTAGDDPALAAAMEGADLVVPDGMPLVWWLRRTTRAEQERIFGPDLMHDVCGLAAADGTPVFLYGSTPETLELLTARLHERFPALQIAGSISPPFRPLSADEDAAFIAQINASGARIVFVGLGAPKQEQWMLAHRGRVQAVMLGVGAAFDYHAGRLKRAPVWMQRAGLEWLFRLMQEPRRLFTRYLSTNTRFVWRALRAALRRRG